MIITEDVSVDLGQVKNTAWQKISSAYRMDETVLVNKLLSDFVLSAEELDNIKARSINLIERFRAKRGTSNWIEAFMFQYDLSSKEGIALMCLAEALLRIKDGATKDLLIKDKLTKADWGARVGESDVVWVNLATRALSLTCKVIADRDKICNAKILTQFSNTLAALIKKLGQPVIRFSVMQVMKMLGHQFVMGKTIAEAVSRAVKPVNSMYLYSYDMLGEAAYTKADAEYYFTAYKKAIDHLRQTNTTTDLYKNPGISVKLSALHPRYEIAKEARVMAELLPKLVELALLAKEANIGLTVDAEESYRLELSLLLIEKVITHEKLSLWDGFGLAVQAYQKRALFVIDWLVTLCRVNHKKITLRLVKGAYWDAEIKYSQERGLSSYPVFTRKSSTDLNYLVCAKKMIEASDVIYPQFATHNAYSIAAILEMIKKPMQFEFQCLHGMGVPLYSNIVGKDLIGNGVPLTCRVYAPVGGHELLLCYLVRRLLENGANSSFVNNVSNKAIKPEELAQSPMQILSKFTSIPHHNIPLPFNLFGQERSNSQGVDLSCPQEFMPLLNKMEQILAAEKFVAKPTIFMPSLDKRNVVNPAEINKIIGVSYTSNLDAVERSMQKAAKAFNQWHVTTAAYRAGILEKMAVLLEENKVRLMAILIAEAGKTLGDAVAEVREAIDFCWYYAKEARAKFSEPRLMPGPTGELNQLSLHGRGVIVCISPWNFPLAIFLGQITAALAAGNTVVTKPSEQTTLIAAMAIDLLKESGVPDGVVELILGKGSVVGAAAIAHAATKGVMFTGSTQTARFINQVLANKEGDLVPFIAETGGQNAMIVDSSALPEQVVRDVLVSAFGSAGQRCSSLRVLFLQNEIADKVIHMLVGAMAEIQLGDPLLLSTDIGPIIDANAKQMLEEHVQQITKQGKVLAQITLEDKHAKGHFFAPIAIELNNIQQLSKEVFGPVLHVIKYKADELQQIIEDINHTGYGLTLGIHSRIDTTIKLINSLTRVGNTYVNRNMVGAVVGVQPFGGEGLSGTGPKAGGPHYLLRLVTERTLTIDTTAAGGNASLMSMD